MPPKPYDETSAVWSFLQSHSLLGSATQYSTSHWTGEPKSLQLLLALSHEKAEVERRVARCGPTLSQQADETSILHSTRTRLPSSTRSPEPAYCSLIPDSPDPAAPHRAVIICTMIMRRRWGRTMRVRLGESWPGIHLPSHADAFTHRREAFASR